MDRLPSWMLPAGLWLAASAYAVWWTLGNPLPDGFQNEYLHVGNAYDLWEALRARDVWHLRWYMYTGYWPWGLYAVPWPFLAVLGPGRLALVCGNLVHLGVLLWGAWSLGRALGAPLAPLLLLLCPGVFGTLVRFEPNFADIAWVTAGLAFLVRSRGLTDRRAMVGWGACLGVGLMMDRLAVVFFLVPALLPLLRGADPRAWRNLLLGGGVTLALTAAYYREFFLRHSDELLSQAPVGEIDAVGTVAATEGLGGLYYPLALIDSQAGPGLGVVMLLGLGHAIWMVFTSDDGGRRRSLAVLAAAVVAPAVFFTVVAKKQVFYTLPILGPLAVLAAGRGRLAWAAAAGGGLSLLTLGLGALPLDGPGRPPLPERWVAPRHTLARPPSRQVWPLDAAIDGLISAAPAPRQISVISEDDRLFEGFVALAVRERRPGVPVRGVVTDPQGTYELFAETDALLWVGEIGGAWPSAADIEAELLADHYRLAQLPPVARLVAEAGGDFEPCGRWPAGDLELVCFVRVAPALSAPESPSRSM